VAVERLVVGVAQNQRGSNTGFVSPKPCSETVKTAVTTIIEYAKRQHQTRETGEGSREAGDRIARSERAKVVRRRAR
jgi:hypothetical protein